MLKNIEGFEDLYQINILGQIYSCRSQKYLKPQISKKGYYVVDLYDSKNNKRKLTTVHRLIYHHFIASITPKDNIDHINGNTLDNSIQNLRVASHQNNMRNSKCRKNSFSKYKGVSFCKTTKKWRAQLARIENGIKKTHIGRYLTEKEAALEYDNYAKKFYGKYARVNFLCGLDI